VSVRDGKLIRIMSILHINNMNKKNLEEKKEESLIFISKHKK
jgi:hypothetical protein